MPAVIVEKRPAYSQSDRRTTGIVSYFWKPREEKARPHPVYILGNIKLDLSWSILFRIILCRERTCCLRTGGKETSKAKVSRQRAPLKGIEGEEAAESAQMPQHCLQTCIL